MARISRSIEVAAGLHLQCVAVGEVPDRFRQLRRVRHRGAVEQHRKDDELAPLNRIGRVHDPRLAVGLRPNPVMADNGDQQIAGLQRIVDMLAENRRRTGRCRYR
jgi:hypothetical protein